MGNFTDNLNICCRSLLGMVALLLGIGGTYSFILADYQREASLKTVDAKLLTAAHAAKRMLPFGYHDGITGKDSVSPDQFERFVDNNNRLCLDDGLQYVWSVLVEDERHIYFTSSTSPDHRAENGRHAKFFDLHNDPAAFAGALSSMKPHFSTFKNEWGWGRMVLIPERDRLGRVVMFGASIDVPILATLLYDSIMHSLAVAGIVLLLGLIPAIFFSKTLSGGVQQAAAAAQRIAGGDYHGPVQFGGSRELVTLSNSLSSMQRAILEQVRALREGEERYHGLVESQHDLIVRVDTDGRFTFANDAYCRKHGVNREEIIGKKSYEPFVHPEDLPLAIETVKSIHRPPHRARIELRALTVDGVRWVEWEQFAIQDEFGRVTEVQAIGRDTHYRKQMEEALSRSEQQLRMITNSGPTLIAYVDPDGRYRWANEIHEQWFGLRPAALRGRHMREVLGEGAWDSIQPVVTRVLSGHAATHEQRLLLQEGDPRWMRATYTPDCDDAGHVRGFVVHATDISERKRAEEYLAREKNLSEAAINSLPGVFYLCDKDGTFLRWNMNLEEVSGYSSQQIAAMRTTDFFDKNEMDKITAAMEDIKSEGKARVEAWVSTKNGKKRLYSLNAFRMINDGASYLIGTGIDITEQRQIEDRLRHKEYELRTLAENSPDMITRFDSALRYIYVNHTYEQIVGLSRDRVMGRTNAEVGIPHPLVQVLDESLQTAMETEQAMSIDFSINGIVGTRHFLSTMTPEFSSEGYVETIMMVARDITALKLAEEHIRFISFHDPVTGLFNRAYYEEDIKRVDTERELPISIVVGDVNNLKVINDVFGHDEGDRCLKVVADTLKRCCRSGEMVARVGGDEFAIILPQTDGAAAADLAHRIRTCCAETTDAALSPGIALGVATKTSPDDDIRGTLREAEVAMYDDKVQGSEHNQECMLRSLLQKLRERVKGTDAFLERTRVAISDIGKFMALPNKDIEILTSSFLFHELGTLFIPDAILAKEGALNDDEWEDVKRHPEGGLRIARGFRDSNASADVILSLHERWDGEGYPRALKGDDIPFLARILTIIIAYGVMMKERPYKIARTEAEAMEEIQRNAGRQFDPHLAECFVSAISSRRAS